jgi:ZIP family zinc transporter
MLVALTALGVGGATIFGALLGFIFRKIPHKWNDGIMSFASGIMLAAAVVGLILPSLDIVGAKGSWISAIGIICGAVFLNLMDKVTPHLHRISGIDQEQHSSNESLNKILLSFLRSLYIIFRKDLPQV